MAEEIMPYCFSDRQRIEQVAPGVYRIDLCMPQAIGPTNSYIFKADGIRDNGRSLIIDAGCNHPSTKQLFDEVLAQLEIDWNAVDIFITHFHWDHWAGLAQIWHPGITVYAGIDSATQSNTPVMASEEVGDIERAVSERHMVGDTYDRHYWQPMTITGDVAVPLKRVHEGKVFQVGAYQLRVLETPGHDLNHVCLYDEAAGLFVAGDQMLYNQHPSIMMESEGDQLGVMLETIKRLRSLNASLVLCGHGGEGSNLLARCDQVLDHYERQLASFREVCVPGITDPGELAYLSTQQPRRTPWENRLIFGRRALLAQTAAFLRHLVVIGELEDVYRITPLR